MEPSSAERCSGRYHVLCLAVRHLLYNSKPHRKSSAPPSILPRVVSFFDLRELVGISIVSKKWKEFCYEPEVVLGCISRGGVNEKDRANFWLLCAGMRDESVAQQPMGLLDVVGLNFRSSEGDNDTTDGNGEEERRETLETLTDEDFLKDSPKMLELSPLPPRNFQGRSSNWAQRVHQWRTSHKLNRNQSSSRLLRQSPVESASEHRKKLLQSDAGHRVCGLYDALRESSEAIDGCECDEDLFASHPRRTITQIDKDVERTANFANRDALRSLLRAISLYMPKSVGYVQGQNFICRVLLTATKEHEEDAFWACIGMMHHFGLLGIICPGMPTLRLRFFQMNHLVMWHLPKLFQHFHDNEVEAELYSTSWFITLLSDGALLQEKDVLPLWDVLFALCGDRDEQWAVVYRVILELMRLSEQTILLLSSLPSIVGGMSKIMASHVAHAGGIMGLQSSAEIYLEHSVTMPKQLSMLRGQWTSSV
eukprot:102470_1